MTDRFPLYTGSAAVSAPLEGPATPQPLHQFLRRVVRTHGQADGCCRAVVVRRRRRGCCGRGAGLGSGHVFLDHGIMGVWEGCRRTPFPRPSECPQ
jgi:hypothetical protein